MTNLLAFPAPERPPQRARRAKAPFTDAVLLCGKCARKLPGRQGKAVRKALKAALKSRRWGKVRVVETRCLDVCPKHRQVLASWRTLAEGRLLVVEPGFDAQAVLEQLIGAPAFQPGSGAQD